MFYNNKKDLFENISNNDIKLDRTNALTSDKNNNIWIATDNGLWICDQNKKLKNVISNIRVFHIFYYNNEVYYTSTSGVFKIKYNNSKIQNIKITDRIKDVSVLKIFNSEIYLGTKNGRLYKSNITNFNFNEIKISNKINGLRIKDIEFNDNKFYFATDGAGIFITNNELEYRDQFFFNNDKQNSLTSNGVYDIYFSNDLTWIATYGGGVNYYSRNKQLFTILKHQINNSNSLANNTVRSILEIKNELLIGYVIHYIIGSIFGFIYVSLNKFLIESEEVSFKEFIKKDSINSYIASPLGFWFTYTSKNNTSYFPKFGDKVMTCT